MSEMEMFQIQLYDDGPADFWLYTSNGTMRIPANSIRVCASEPNNVYVSIGGPNDASFTQLVVDKNACLDVDAPGCTGVVALGDLVGRGRWSCANGDDLAIWAGIKN